MDKFDRVAFVVQLRRAPCRLASQLAGVILHGIPLELPAKHLLLYERQSQFYDFILCRLRKYPNGNQAFLPYQNVPNL